VLRIRSNFLQRKTHYTKTLERKELSMTTHLVTPRNTVSVQSLTRQRLAGGFLLIIALVFFLFGTQWDIQWHATVGRDRVLTPPHLLMLGGIVLAGLTSLFWIVLETWQASVQPTVFAERSSRFLGFFRGPVGFALSGFGALFSAIAFPLDDYWHTLYGIDVTLWAPFHVMIISGMVMAGLGLAYVLASERNRAEGQLRTVVGVMVVVALALTLVTLLLFLPPTLNLEGIAYVAGQAVILYPVLVALTLPLALLSIALLSQTSGTATLLALVFLGLKGIGVVFVPWATATLVAAQGLEYRLGGPDFVVATRALPLGILGAAVVVDALTWWANRQKRFSIPLLLVGTTFACAGAALLDQPWAAASLLPRLFPEIDLSSAFTNALLPTGVAAFVGGLIALVIGRGLIQVRR
jgi:hypothetical protein